MNTACRKCNSIEEKKEDKWAKHILQGLTEEIKETNSPQQIGPEPDQRRSALWTLAPPAIKTGRIVAGCRLTTCPCLLPQ